MILLFLLVAATAVAGLVGSLVALPHDGHRRIPDLPARTLDR